MTSARILQFIEIDVDYCSLTYSVPPCQARLDFAADAISSDTVLFLDGSGADDSTTFTDLSPAAHGNATAVGDAQVDTSQFVYGTGSIYLDGNGDRLTFPDSADWDFGSGAFTVHWRERRHTAGAGRCAIARDTNTTFCPFLFGYDDGAGVLQVYMTSDGASFDIASGKNLGTYTLNVWSHRAVVRDGNNFYLFKDGVQTDTWTSSAAIFPNANPLSIGRCQNAFDLGANIDELEIIKGRALWTSAFTPPTRATVLFTGTKKCFNTAATCQDRANFTNVPVTLRFCVPTEDLAGLETLSIPNIKDINFDPSTISLGKDLGQRATLTVSFDDHRHSDTGEGFDKYLADRTYDPYRQGSFWGKFSARQPFLRGRSLRWKVGRPDQLYSDWETRHFIIDSFSGPDNNGVFKIIAKDVLKLADGDRAMAPVVSQGFLVADITNVATTLTLSPSGIGATYPASGYVAIGGSEIVSFTRVDSPPSDVMTIGRGQLGTTAATHNAQDRVQLCLRYAAVSPEVIIADLLENYAAVSSSFIPLADWSAEVTAHLNRLYTATIAQPTSVNTLVSELIEQAGLSMWWNDRDQEIGMLVLRGLIYTTDLFTEDNVVADTLQISEQPDKRLSQVHTYFGQINPLTSLTDKANYRSASIISDAQSESDYGSAMIQEIFSRWIPALGRTVADRIGTILIGRFKDPPRKLKFSVLRNSLPEVLLAHGYQLEAWPLQIDTGEGETVNMQVTRLRPNPDLIEVETEEVLYTAAAEDLTVRNIIVDANINSINLRTTHDNIYPAPESGITVNLTINNGVIVGSTSTATMALDIGSWPSGVTINVHCNGRIEGRGGDGGGAEAPLNPTGAGYPGGTALYTRYAINLILNTGAGQVWGGGGGGGGISGVGNISGGGGGGAGQLPGTGGAILDPPHGQNGTTEAGGAGGGSSGDGGGPGLDGEAAGGGSGSAGGAAGKSIDGTSFVTKTGTGDIRGAEIN